MGDRPGGGLAAEPGRGNRGDPATYQGSGSFVGDFEGRRRCILTCPYLQVMICSGPLDCLLLCSWEKVPEGASATPSQPLSLPCWPKWVCCPGSIQEGHRKGSGPRWHAALRRGASLPECVSVCVCAGAHKVTVWGRDDETD